MQTSIMLAIPCLYWISQHLATLNTLLSI